MKKYIVTVVEVSENTQKTPTLGQVFNRLPIPKTIEKTLLEIETEKNPLQAIVASVMKDEHNEK